MKRLSNSVDNLPEGQNHQSDKHTRLKMMLFVFALTVYGLFAYVFGNESICIFKIYAGLPCPGCGMTRSFLALSKGHFHEAFYWHPLWSLVLIGPIVYAVLDRLKESHKRKAAFIWIVFALFVGAYVYRMVVYFPHQAPMDFNSNAYFYRIYEFFVK